MLSSIEGLRYLTIACLRHQRLIVQLSTDEVNWQLIQHYYTAEGVAQISAMIAYRQPIGRCWHERAIVQQRSAIYR